MAIPLVIGPDEEAALADLQQRAMQNPLDVLEVLELAKTPRGLKEHRKRMAESFSVTVPFGYRVTFSIEDGHPAGRCRHMSMSSPDKAKVPSPEAVWMICEYLGFKGGLEACQAWKEDFDKGHIAINIVQPIPN